MVADPTSAPIAIRDTFDAGFEAARPRLLAVAHGLIGSDEAEDVVQEAYLRARSRIGQLREPSLFDPWLARIVVNLCFNRHRRRRIARHWMSALARSAADTSRDLGLRELIERLEPRERTVVVLHYGHGYRTEEIAALLSLTPTNVRTILFRTRARLRAELEAGER
jgi:RNA polymerase sigma-70 factor (ECF subfamily)